MLWLSHFQFHRLVCFIHFLWQFQVFWHRFPARRLNPDVFPLTHCLSQLPGALSLGKGRQSQLHQMPGSLSSFVWRRPSNSILSKKQGRPHVLPGFVWSRRCGTCRTQMVRPVLSARAGLQKRTSTLGEPTFVVMHEHMSLFAVCNMTYYTYSQVEHMDRAVGKQL